MENQTQELNDIYAEILLPNSILVIFGTVFGILGNIVILYAYALGVQDDAGERYFIPILAFIDTIGCITSIVYYLLDNYFLFVFPSDSLCRVLSFLMCFTSGFSGNTLLVIALQRYLLICRPLGRQLSSTSRRLAVFILLLVTFIYSSPLFATSGIRTSTKVFLNQNVTGNTCVLSVQGGGATMAYFLLLLVIIIVNISVVAAFYIPVTKTIYHHLKMKNRRRSYVHNFRMSIAVISNNRDSTDTNAICTATRTHRTISTESAPQAKTRINIMFLAIITVYIFSYVPSFAILLITYTIEGFDYLQLSPLGINAWIFSARLIVLNHIVNPFIYGYFDGKLKSKLKSLFFRK
ncbi:neuropeptide Y receptor type 4-like [Saccostrea cucullata]|uniref:neuropeptide Y receptor type 4-like n=1 Tax=Saccostrea cuccullata TaxID=36930 RepID=UPI002ED6C078